jgi:tetratricopeptide (TPR) repeat protein
VRTEDRGRAEQMLRAALAETDPAWADGLVAARIHDRLGIVLAATERFDEARQQHEHAYTLALAALGPTHPTTLAARGNLARVTSELGHPGAAVAIHLDNLQTIALRLGPDSPRLLQTHLDLAAALARVDAESQAIAYLEQGLELARARPDQARRRMLLLNALAYQVSMRGDLPRAMALYREAVDVAESAYGHMTRQAGIARGNLAVVLATSARGREALAEFLYAREVLVVADGPTHPRIGMLHTNIARLANELGEAALVDEHSAAAERIAVLNHDVRLEAGILATRVGVLRKRNELAQARDIQTRVVELFSGGLESAEYRRALFDLGCIERELGHSGAALQALAQAHELALARDSTPWRLAEIEFEIGLAEWDAGRHEVARAAVERAVAGWQADADDEVGAARADHLALAEAWLREHGSRAPRSAPR